jgi:hypothetical protein
MYPTHDTFASELLERLGVDVHNFCGFIAIEQSFWNETSRRSGRLFASRILVLDTIKF